MFILHNIFVTVLRNYIISRITKTIRIYIRTYLPPVIRLLYTHTKIPIIDFLFLKKYYIDRYTNL